MTTRLDCTHGAVQPKIHYKVEICPALAIFESSIEVSLWITSFSLSVIVRKIDLSIDLNFNLNNTYNIVIRK